MLQRERAGPLTECRGRDEDLCLPKGQEARHHQVQRGAAGPTLPPGAWTLPEG